MTVRQLPVSQAVYQVLRSAEGPLSLDQVIEGIEGLPVRATVSVHRAAVSALRRSPQVVLTRSGAYALASFALKGAAFRHILGSSDIEQRRLAPDADARYALAPWSFDVPARHDPSPCQLALADGPVLIASVQPIGDGAWGLPTFPALGDWYDSMRFRPGDNLLIEVTDGEARMYHIWPAPAREEARIARRNRALSAAVAEVLATQSRPMPLGRLMAALVSRGVYHDSVPPGPLSRALGRMPGVFISGGRVAMGQQSHPAPARPARALAPQRSWFSRLFRRQR